ncbi:imelysin family protein [Paracoccus beibuensis]|uniref:imelysin family protein n=1 Tax=Paracoccus beibuensis TaxID=547602 RepID=UPI003898D7E6
MLNVIAAPQFTLSGTKVEATQITPALVLDTLHEADGVEANVASGCHAIEFLLWAKTKVRDPRHGAEPCSACRPAAPWLD